MGGLRRIARPLPGEDVPHSPGKYTGNECPVKFQANWPRAAVAYPPRLARAARIARVLQGRDFTGLTVGPAAEA